MKALPTADPVKFVGQFWPNVRLYRQQEDILYSLARNDETVVPAGNMLGKDFIAGLAALWFFLTRHPCRIVTTSADHAQLEAVLWGEIRRFIQTAAFPLEREKGGPLVVNHLHLRKVVGGKVCGLSYCIARVAAKGEGLLGHHIAQTGDGIPRTLLLCDEASGIDDETNEKASTWAHRKLVIGNPFSTTNFFYRAVKGGDVPVPVYQPPAARTSEESPSGEEGSGQGPQEVPQEAGQGPQEGQGSGGRPVGGGPGGEGGQEGASGQVERYFRKIIRIRATDSPNVRMALAYQARGLDPNTAPQVLPGVLPWPEYVKRRATWDAILQCVGLDAEFYEGAENLLFPPQWLNLAADRARLLEGRPRRAEAVGCDPAEGGDNTCLAAVDRYGLIELVGFKTPDTSVIKRQVVAFGTRHGAPPGSWLLDRGGGGKQIADELRRAGYPVRTVAFGEAVTPEPRRGMVTLKAKVFQSEERYAYFNRRAELFGELSRLIDPTRPEGPDPYFALPARYAELRKQLAVFPKQFDSEGRLKLPPKNKKGKETKEPSLTDLIGHSPDEADAVALAVYGMLRKGPQFKAGVLWK